MQAPCTIEFPGVYTASACPRFAIRSIEDLFATHGRSFPVGRGASLYAEETAADQVYLIVAGCVRVGRYEADGKRQINAFHFAGEMFGFEPGRRHRFFAEAVSACELTVLPRATLQNLAALDGALARRLWGHAEDELQRAQEHMLLCRQAAVSRVLHFIEGVAERLGDPFEVELPMSRQDMADHLGLTIETVSRAMTCLSANGETSTTGARRVRLRRPHQLAA
ncbi:helix-turn-helix domain-containing protein [Aureimonas mangrovi]|uniref:helix-turn-helix domain-containing protein n=1 Tax=Aureimonas mangrovi TaxID=2758041 RepID=UPI00163DC92D|nr:helix-turn-helix domain-containing protein [Aureimonas mangrovi]